MVLHLQWWVVRRIRRISKIAADLFSLFSLDSSDHITYVDLSTSRFDQELTTTSQMRSAMLSTILLHLFGAVRADSAKWESLSRRGVYSLATSLISTPSHRQASVWEIAT